MCVLGTVNSLCRYIQCLAALRPGGMTDYAWEDIREAFELSAEETG